MKLLHPASYSNLEYTANLVRVHLSHNFITTNYMVGQIIRLSCRLLSILAISTTAQFIQRRHCLN